MKIVHSFRELKTPIQPVILTIGNFDGVHLGHQFLINHLRNLALKENLPSVILTFENHPASIIHPNQRTTLLTTLPHKLMLFEELGVDYALVLPFTKELSEKSARDFLREVYRYLPFRSLILGYDAKLGNDRLGESPEMHALANELHAFLEFIQPVKCNALPISSSRIRKAIQNEDLHDAFECLGRKYSLTGYVIHGKKIGKSIGFPTINLSLEGLCYPRFGIYAVTVKTHQGSFPGVANLGVAPTVRSDRTPLLETFILQGTHDLYNQWVEVVFEEFIRPEKIFANVVELQKQIQQDVIEAKEFFKI